MPIYDKTTAVGGNPNTAEIDYHTSEAAKVKRTREQAYFNSYDFDAIEVLPYDEDEDDDKHRLNTNYKRGQQALTTVQQQQQQSQQQEVMKSRRNAKISHPIHHHYQQQLQQQPLSHTFSNANTGKDSFIVDTYHYQQQQQPSQQHVNIFKSNYKPTAYLQRIAGLLHHKTAGHSLKHDFKSTPDALNQTNNSNSRNTMEESSSAKHFKTPSTTTSTSLTATTAVAQVIRGGVGTVISRDREQDRDAPYDYVMDETIAARVSNGEKINSSTKAVNSGGEAAVDTAKMSSAAAGGDGNFLLPRAMLKHQSSNLMPPGGAAAATITAAASSTGLANIANSMPLATNNNISNNNQSTGIKQQQQQQRLQTITEPDSLDELKANNSNMAATSGGGAGGGISKSVTGPLRLKKTSLASSLNSSLGYGGLEEAEVEEEHHQEATTNRIKEEPKVLPKTSCINLKTSARASSHQSHYSTDKSASSGYYSSNMCSTYSLEEHIYSEPTTDLKKLKHQPLKESVSETNLMPLAIFSAPTLKVNSSSTLKNKQQLQQQQQQQHQQHLTQPLTSLDSDPNSVMRTLNYTRRYHYADNNGDLDSQTPPSPAAAAATASRTQTLPVKRKSQEFNENLKILESSIENLDRHLKTFPGPNSQEVIYSHQDKQRHLPTIQEAFDSLKKPTSWIEDRSDDSLMDIDLDSFLLDKDKAKQQEKSRNCEKGLVNPSFLPEEQEENHYKCAKYINSCPEDAYRVESDILAPAHSSISGQSLAAVSVDLYPKRYEEQLHFENTRELLEDVRDKIRLLTQTQGEMVNTTLHQQHHQHPHASREDYIPQELNTMINTLKRELELYLERMNQHSEQEIRQLCSGLVKNQNIVKMKNAFERRRSLSDTTNNDVYTTYEAIQDGIVLNNQGIPISIRQQQITSIRCSSDPNFKMKRKSITEVFPMAERYIESIQADKCNKDLPITTTTTQLQKNLSFHKPVLEQLSNSENPHTNNNHKTNKTSSSGDNTDETNDKESILDWHRKKPSIWEMYYGTNRIQQSLLGVRKNGMVLTTTGSSPSAMCYPSSRPESDFTLDLPRAEQLRIKMEKEKKFRQRCRVITTFLSLVFFLLTVMVVSLVLTRGKRMFGSMI